MLDRRRIFILPTGQGLAYAGVLVVMLLGAINYNNSLGHLLTFVLGSLALVSMLHTYRNLAGLSIRGGRTEPVFAGEKASFALRLENRLRLARHALCVKLPRQPSQGRREQTETLMAQVPAQGLKRIELKVTAPRRGRFRLGRVTVTTRFPLGLFRAWSPLDLGISCLVYPRPAGELPLPVSGTEESSDGRHRGEGREDFFGLRDHQPGDPPTQIHWKAAAREQELPVKVFGGGSQRDIYLRWDEAGGDMEERLSQLCRWVLDAHRWDLRYGLEIPGVVIVPERGEAHMGRCLRTLALYGMDDA